MDLTTMTYDVRDHVAHVRFARPEGANAVNPAFSADLRAVMVAIEFDDDVRAVSVTAEGKVFCAGGDLKLFHEAGSDVASLASDMLVDYHGAIYKMNSIPKPFVAGVGGIGLNIVQGARLAGAERIIAVDLSADKLALATRFGATDVVNPADGDPVAEVVELTGGGVDYAFEAIGLPLTAGQAFGMIRPGRTAYLVGVPAAGTTVELPGTLMTLTAKGLQGVFMGSNNFKRDIPMLANLYLQGRLDLDTLVAAQITLEQVNDGYAAMQGGNEARSVIVF